MSVTVGGVEAFEVAAGAREVSGASVLRERGWGSGREPVGRRATIGFRAAPASGRRRVGNLEKSAPRRHAHPPLFFFEKERAMEWFKGKSGRRSVRDHATGGSDDDLAED